MTSVKEIEKAIESLPKNEIAELSAWFEKFEAELWDDEIEKDVENGRFADLFAEAAADHADRRTQLLPL